MVSILVTGLQLGTVPVTVSQVCYVLTTKAVGVVIGVAVALHVHVFFRNPLLD